MREGSTGKWVRCDISPENPVCRVFSPPTVGGVAVYVVLVALVVANCSPGGPGPSSLRLLLYRHPNTRDTQDQQLREVSMLS